MNRKWIGWRIGLIVAIVTVFFLPIAKAESKGRRTKAKTKKLLDFVVINKATKEPIPNVKLRIRINRRKREDKTDKQGRCKIALGKRKLDYLSVEARKEGFTCSSLLASCRSPHRNPR